MKLLRDPTLHFAVLGTMLFVLYSVVGSPGNGAKAGQNVIEVTPEQREQLKRDYTLKTGQPPDQNTLDGLVDDWVDQEILFREALSLGLHRSDEIVRRRLIQVMGFLLEDLAPVPQPDEETLRGWYQDHQNEYRSQERVSFQQVFFSGPDALERARAGMAALQGGTEWNGLGDPFINGRSFKAQTRARVAATFGEDFADSLWTLPEDEWGGPFRSTYGLHLVRITERQPGSMLPFEAVRDQVEESWEDTARKRANAAARERLRERYTVQRQSP